MQAPGIATKAFYLATSMHHEAVVLFFVVSGFLIGGPVWEQIGHGTFQPKRYLLNRFTRIYIVLVPALLLMLVLQGAGVLLSGTRLMDVRPLQPIGITAGFTWDQFACHLAALPAIACAPWGANPPLWSFGYEWALYLLAPITIAAWRLPSRMIVSAALSGALAILVVMTMPAGWPLWFGAWAVGVVAHRILATGTVPTAAGLAGLAACVGAMISSRTGQLPILATDVAIAIGLALAISCKSIVRLSIAPKAMHAGAGFSYSLYLIHLPVAVAVGAFLEKLGWPSVLSQPGVGTYSAFAITIFVTMASAWTFSRVTEANTEAVRDWIARRDPRTRTALRTASPPPTPF